MSSSEGPIPGKAIGGYFASSAFIESDEEYSKISGRSFGWMELSSNREYRDDKSKMRRPTLDEWRTIFQPYHDKFEL